METTYNPTRPNIVGKRESFPFIKPMVLMVLSPKMPFPARMPETTGGCLRGDPRSLHTEHPHSHPHGLPFPPQSRVQPSTQHIQNAKQYKSSKGRPRDGFADLRLLGFVQQTNCFPGQAILPALLQRKRNRDNGAGGKPDSDPADNE